MDETTRQSIHDTAREAAALNQQDPGMGYAYAVGTVYAMLTDGTCPAEEKVARALLFLVDFRRARREE